MLLVLLTLINPGGASFQIPITSASARTYWPGGGYPVSNAFDGNPGTFYHSYGSAAPQWLILQLQTRAVIDFVQIEDR